MDKAPLPTALPAIPAKRYFTIGEVSELCGVKAYVLRYWEQEFTQLKPMKRRGNRRYYQHHEVLLIRRIRELLYEQGFTISGARNQLNDAGAVHAVAAEAARAGQPAASLAPRVRDGLEGPGPDAGLGAPLDDEDQDEDEAPPLAALHAVQRAAASSISALPALAGAGGGAGSPARALAAGGVASATMDIALRPKAPAPAGAPDTAQLRDELLSIRALLVG